MKLIYQQFCDRNLELRKRNDELQLNVNKLEAKKTELQKTTTELQQHLAELQENNTYRDNLNPEVKQEIISTQKLNKRLSQRTMYSYHHQIW